MLKSLRKRPQPDALKTEQRRVTNKTGRLVYLTMLLALVTAGLNFLFGDLVFLRADGLVLRDKTTVSTTYLARVETVNVTPGQAISVGTPILSLQSTEILERLADLSSKKATLTAKAAEFKIRAETAARLLPLAEKREIQTAKMLQKMHKLSITQVATHARYADALRSRFDAQQSYVELEAQNHALKDELVAVDAARADAEKALTKLRDHYADGVVAAPINGAIGTSVPSQGDVYRPGETILEVYSGKAYVLAYLPRSYLFAVETGTRVNVKSGRLSATGIITDILPFTAALPKEFQNSFKPRDRSQLARISFNKAPQFPLHAKVSLTLEKDLF
jgi:multidrug resistance efflux pump